MSGSLPLLRRRLFGAVALSTLSMLSSGSQAAPQPENACERMRKKLVSLLNDPESARKIGTLYLRLPTERLAPPLELAETTLAEMGEDAHREAIRHYIAARIRRELRDLQVISLDGWIMSETEARLCGLAAGGATPSSGSVIRRPI